MHSYTQACAHPPIYGHKHTLLSTPFPKAIVLTSLKNISNKGFGSKVISCTLRPPHLQIPTHGNTEGFLSPGCYFYSHCGWQSDGRTHLVQAFQWHEWLQTQACECKCANTNTNAHRSIHKHRHRQSALKAHEMLIYFSLRDQRR